MGVSPDRGGARSDVAQAVRLVAQPCPNDLGRRSGASAAGPRARARAAARLRGSAFATGLSRRPPRSSVCLFQALPVILRVLIADDQPDVLEALRLLLKGEGYRIEAAGSPAGILEAIDGDEFDAVLMDLNYARDTRSGQEGSEKSGPVGTAGTAYLPPPTAWRTALASTRRARQWPPRGPGPESHEPVIQKRSDDTAHANRGESVCQAAQGTTRAPMVLGQSPSAFRTGQVGLRVYLQAA